MKRVFNCNGSIEEDKEMGEIIQLQGDQRDNARACGGGGGGNGGGVLLFFARCSAPRAPTLSPRSASSRARRLLAARKRNRGARRRRAGRRPRLLKGAIGAQLSVQWSGVSMSMYLLSRRVVVR